MVTPISNDKLPSSSNPKAGGANTKSTGGANAGSTGANASAAVSEASKPADDTINVDRANQLYRSAISEPTELAGIISTSEEAAQLASLISEQLAANGSLAMQAQTSSLPGQIGSLLSAAP